MSDLAGFVASLPKAELHVHHVGSASVEAVSTLAARHEGSTPVPAEPTALADYFRFTDFGHFIEVYLSVVDLLRTPEDLWTLTHQVGTDLAEQPEPPCSDQLESPPQTLLVEAARLWYSTFPPSPWSPCV